MRLAIADPPYLGRANRWYGSGRGVSGGRGRADAHPEAARWDTLEAHRELIADLVADYDGWALFTGVHGLRSILPLCPPDVVLAAWVVTNAPPSGSRILTGWEPVIFAVPPGRSAHGTGPTTRSGIAAAAPRLGFAGAKPETVTGWCLDVLGYDQDTDELVDLFPGSGAIARAAGQLRLPLEVAP